MQDYHPAIKHLSVFGFSVLITLLTLMLFFLSAILIESEYIIVNALISLFQYISVILFIISLLTLVLSIINFHSLMSKDVDIVGRIPASWPDKIFNYLVSYLENKKRV